MDSNDSHKIFSPTVRTSGAKKQQLYSKLQGAITSEDVLGKDVIDSEGVFIGVSDKFYIDPKNMIILGVSVDKGFLRKGFIISTHYIREVSEHAVFLNMQPSTLHKGKDVIGDDGVHIGKIMGVNLAQDTNSILSIVVRPGLFRKRFVIPNKYIASTRVNVFLNITNPELQEKIKAHPDDWFEK